MVPIRAAVGVAGQSAAIVTSARMWQSASVNSTSAGKWIEAVIRTVEQLLKFRIRQGFHFIIRILAVMLC